MLPERFWAKVDKTPTCWLWTGSVDGHGYGQFKVGGTRVHVHRLTYTDVYGPIPNDMELDHLCRTRACVNPAHLEVVTHAENVRRGLAGRINNHNARKTHCAKGHPYDEENTASYKNGWRTCRQCYREKESAKYYRTRQLKGTRPRGEENTQAKLTAQAVREIRARHAAGEHTRSLALEYGVTRAAVQLVVTRKTWKHVD